MENTDSKKEYTIVTASGGAAYEGLRALWSEVFGDPLLYIDAFYESFGDDIRGYAVVDSAGEVCSALTCYPCGTYDGRPVWVSYAICTRKDRRRLGLAGMLVEHVRDEVIAAGGISLVSPAEPSLESYYAGLGYEPHFLAAERAVLNPDFDAEEFDDFDEFDIDIEGASPTPFRSEIDLQRVSAVTYNKYREAFLSGCPHVELNNSMLRLIQNESMDERGLFIVNGGDAICVIGGADAGRVSITELIVSPVLLELSLDIDAEIAAMIAKRFGAFEAVYRTPGFGGCQSMAAGLPQSVHAETGGGGDAVNGSGPSGAGVPDFDPDSDYPLETAWPAAPYFGFPVD